MSNRNLSNLTSVSGSDSLSIFSSEFGCGARVSVGVLAQYIADLSSPPASYVTQYAAPNATGFSVSIAAAGDGLGQSVWLLLTPTAGFAAGTIVLPGATILNDGQELLVNTTQAVTTLTITGNGATVYGAPSTLAANAFFRLRYDKVTNGWYRVN